MSLLAGLGLPGSDRFQGLLDSGEGRLGTRVTVERLLRCGRLLVRMNWRRTSNSASRIWRACTLQAMATTAPASPAAPSPSKAAMTGWLAPAVAAAAASMSSP